VRTICTADPTLVSNPRISFAVLDGALLRGSSLRIMKKSSSGTAGSVASRDAVSGVVEHGDLRRLELQHVLARLIRRPYG